MGTDTDPNSAIDEDDLMLMKMGYEKKLHRGLTAFSNFAFGFTEVAVFASFTSLYGYGLVTGGPSVIVWGFVTTFIMTMIVSFSMAEICAAYPSAGSVYHWTAQVVPEKYAPFCSYVCGWFNILGNAAGDGSFAFSFALFLNSAILASHGTPYGPQETVGVSIAIIFVWSILNFFRVDKVGWVNNIAAFIQFSSLFMIIICILVMPDKLATADFVFTNYHNETGFSSKSYVVVIGLLTSLFSFAGYEASAHMAEETEGAASHAPNGIIYTCLATGVGGLCYLLAMLFATVDLDAVLAGPTDSAAVNVFILACGDKWGQAFAWLAVINLFLAGVSSVAVTGRITFALFRDHAFPMSDFFSQVHPTLKSPINAIMFVFVFDALIQLIPLDPGNGSTAFYSIVGLTTIGFQVSYAIPLILKVIFDPKDFPKTPKDLGVWSKPLGVISTVWLLGTAIFFFLPTGYPVTSATMNYVIVVVAGCFVLCALNWLFNSQYHFKGPRRHQAVSGAPSGDKPHKQVQVEPQHHGYVGVEMAPIEPVGEV